MTYVLINPGTGPVSDATLANAEHNILRFVADLAPLVQGIECKRRQKDDDGEGRFAFVLRVGTRKCHVLMPGCPETFVRDLDERLPHIPPRLYVDGNSWFWYFAVGIAMEALGVELDHKHSGGCPVNRKVGPCNCGRRRGRL